MRGALSSFFAPSSRRAFSLVETVIAVGIASFVLVACVGVLTVGLKMNRQSKDMIQSSEAATFLTSILQAEAATGKRPVTDALFPLPMLTNVSQPMTGQYQADQQGLKTSSGAVFDVRYFASRPDTNLARVHLVLSRPVGAPAQNQDHYEADVSIRIP